MVKIRRKKNLVVLDFVAVAHLKFPKGDSPLHQFRPRGRSELVRACARKRMHKTFRTLWRSRARHGSRKRFFFHGVSASATGHGKCYALTSSVMENRLNIHATAARVIVCGNRVRVQIADTTFTAIYSVCDIWLQCLICSDVHDVMALAAAAKTSEL